MTGGRATATTIHQLAEGHVLYYSSADKVLDWFAGFGYRILDISLGEAGYSSSGRTGQAAVQELWSAYESRHPSLPPSTAAAAGGAGSPRKLPALLTVHSHTAADQESSSSAAGSPMSSSSSSSSGGMVGRHEKHAGASYMQQLRVLLQRSGRVRRFEQMTGQHFFQLFAVAFITGLVWWQRGQDYYGGIQAASDVLGLLFFILIETFIIETFEMESS